MARKDSLPDSPKSLMARASEAGREPPESAQSVEFAVRSEKRPSVTIDPIDGETGLWKVSANAVPAQRGARILSLSDLKPDRRAIVTSPFVPKGVSASYLPRLEASRRRTLFRAVSGKSVVPLSSYVFGNEDRAVLSDYSYPWWCVGAVGDGTGTLVGPRLIVTAAHCVDFSGRYSSIFTPGYGNSGSKHSLPSAKVVAWLNGASDGHVCANDFAIGVLSEPLGISHGWMGMKSFNDDWVDVPHFIHVGLRGKVLPSWQAGISVEDGPLDCVELETYCDSESGQSGGPLFAFWGGKPYIVGVLSGYEEEFTFSFPLSFTADHIVFAGGNGMVERVGQMRAEYD